ncbi:hypothetical protein H1R20_g14950, partial [Candolleomyces eurysporus]
MVPVSELAVASFGSTILVELSLQAGFSITTKVANDLVFSKTLNKILPIHSERLETTAIKELIITLKLKLAMEDAQLGFFRSPIHDIGETLLAESASVITLCNRLLPTENGNPDTGGDGDKSKAESSATSSGKGEQQLSTGKPNLVERLSSSFSESLQNLKLRSRSPSPTGSRGADGSPPGDDAPNSAAPSTPPPPPSHPPRHMVLLVVGLKPHRSLWTTSKRPGESVLRYILLNGCVSIVVPVKPGAPLVAWDTLTLEKLWEVELPAEGYSANNNDADLNSDPDDQTDKKKMKESKDGKFEGIVQVLFEYLDLCVDWDRVAVQGSSGESTASGEQGKIAAGPDIHLAVSDESDNDDGSVTETSEQADHSSVIMLRQKKDALKDAVALLVASAIRSKNSGAVKKDVDADRAGIAMWRIR